MGKIIHGNENFGYAPIVVGEGTATFGTPVALKGLTEATIEVEQNTSSIYADNKVWGKIMGAKARTASAKFRYIPAGYAEYLGYHQNANGMLTDTGAHANHCIFFETTEEDTTTGEETKTLHLLYSVKASEPSVESSTDEEEVEAGEIEINYECMESDFVVDDNGVAVQYAYITRNEENAAVYDTFMTNVLLPTTEMK